MSSLCLQNPNMYQFKKGNSVDNCKIEDSVKITQNLFNYNNINKNDLLNRYPYPGVLPNGPATGSWPCRNQSTCNYFDTNNPIIPEHIRIIDLMSLPPN